MGQGRIVVIAALRREVAGLVRGWTRCETDVPGVECFANDCAIVACGGMGAVRATRAVEAALQLGPARVLVSAGWAGACDRAREVGEIVQAEVVVDARTGERFFPISGPSVDVRGAVVTVGMPAGIQEKQRLRASYGAAAVEMEAAAVARAAQAREIPFAAIKAISDGADFEMPKMSGFVTAEGQMREVAFGLHVAMRPAMWRPVMEMAHGSKLAAERLQAALTQWMHEMNP